MEYLTEEECAQVQQLGIVADTLINKYETRSSLVGFTGLSGTGWPVCTAQECLGATGLKLMDSNVTSYEYETQKLF